MERLSRLFSDITIITDAKIIGNIAHAGNSGTEGEGEGETDADGVGEAVGGSVAVNVGVGKGVGVGEGRGRNGTVLNIKSDAA